MNLEDQNNPHITITGIGLVSSPLEYTKTMSLDAQIHPESEDDFLRHITAFDPVTDFPNYDSIRATLNTLIVKIVNRYDSVDSNAIEGQYLKMAFMQLNNVTNLISCAKKASRGDEIDNLLQQVQDNNATQDTVNRLRELIESKQEKEQ